MKRKLAALPPILNETYQNAFAAKADEYIEPESSDNSDVEGRDPVVPSSSGEDLLDVEQCVFCLIASDSIEQNIEHMATSHGLVLPNLEKLQTDVETLILYLGLVTVRDGECLFCGAIKRSAHAARAHMLSKGHCMLNLSPGSEFLEFWESERSDGQESYSVQRSYQLLSCTEMRLPSGAVVTSRNGTNDDTRRKSREEPKELEPPEDALQTEQSGGKVVLRDPVRRSQSRAHPDRQISRRDQMGLTGLSDSQRRALTMAQRKTDLDAMRARNKARWTLEKTGNKVKQKHFVVGSPCRSGWFLDPCMR